MFPIRCASIRLTRLRLFASYLSSSDFRKALPSRIVTFGHTNEPVFSAHYRLHAFYISSLVHRIFSFSLLLLIFPSMALPWVLKLMLSLVSSARSFSTGWDVFTTHKNDLLLLSHYHGSLFCSPLFTTT